MKVDIKFADPPKESNKAEKVESCEKPESISFEIRGSMNGDNSESVSLQTRDRKEIGVF